MSDATKIEWTHRTWNPVRGCSRVSEGCRNCYAERQAVRHTGPGRPYEGLARSTKAGPFDSSRGSQVAEGEARAMARRGYLTCNGFALSFRHPEGGDPSEWPEDLRIREFPEVAA